MARQLGAASESPRLRGPCAWGRARAWSFPLASASARGGRETCRREGSLRKNGGTDVNLRCHEGASTARQAAVAEPPHRVLAIGMHRGGGPPPWRRSCSRDRDRRDDRERRGDDRDYEARGGGRSGARSWMPDRGQRDDRRDSDRAWGPRSGTDDGRGYGGAPRASMGGRQVESQTRHIDSQAAQ